MGNSSDKTDRITDLDLRWDEAAQRHDEAVRDGSYRPDVPRDLDDYLRFLADLAPRAEAQGRGTTPVNEQFTLLG